MRPYYLELSKTSGSRPVCWRSKLGKAVFYLLAGMLSLPLFGQNTTRPNIQGPAGLQVNSYTGSLFYQRSDLFVPGRGLSMDVSFTYNSADRAKDWGYGFGWTFFYNRFYTVNDTSITIFNGDGRKDQYKRSGTDLIAPTGIFDKVINYAAGKYQLTTKEGVQWFFDEPAHKKLTKVVDRNGNEIKLAYTGHNLTSITDASGRVISLVWAGDRLSRIEANSSGAAKKTEYAYDSTGTLKSVKDPLSNVISYTYIRGRLMSSLTDGNGNTVNITYSNSNAVTKFVSCEEEKNISYNSAEFKTYVTDKNNDKTFVTIYAFNAQGNLASKAGNCCGYNTAYSYDEDNNINQIKDANGNVTYFTYDNRGNRLSEIDPLNQSTQYTYEPVYNQVTSVTDKRGNKTEYTYDSKGNLLQLKEPLNVVTTYTYESNGDRRQMTDPRGNKTLFTYDAYGYLATVKDALNGITTLTHDAWGNRLSVQDANNHTTSYAYDAVNQLVSTTNALSHINAFTYDADGNRLSAKDANNNSTSYLYDSRNNPLAITDAANNTSAMQYDAVGNLIGATDAKGNKTTYAYDRQSRRESETNAAGDRVGYSYDGNGNKTTITYPNGNTVNVKYDALNRVTQVADKLGTVATYQYDANNNKIAEADAKGNTTTYAYDALNRLTSKTDPLGNAYVYTYDANGNLIVEKDRNGNSTTYHYDALNRPIKTTDAGGYHTIYAFDAVGNMLSVTDAKGSVTEYTYDVLNRNTQEKFADNTTKAYTYDGEGNLLSRKDGKGQITYYTYDKLNRPVVKTYPGGVDSLGYDATGHLVKAKNSAATVLFNYDNAYRILSENLNGKITAYSYNVAGGTKRITYPGGRIIERKLNERNQLQSINEGATALATFDYNSAGENTGRRYMNGTGTTMQYNGNSQVTSLTASPSNFIDFGYTYDKEGNPLTADFRHRPANSEQYSYDNKNQLSQFKKGSSQQTVYNYDGVGNRISTQVNGVNSAYTANNLNAYTSVVQGTTTNYSYDANGNLISDEITFFEYDIENRLISVSGSAVASYKYDALGRRIIKEFGGDLSNYFFDGVNVIEERNELNSVLKSYVFGKGIDKLVAMKKGALNYFFQTSDNNSIVAITDSLGRPVEFYEYNPFGETQIYSSSFSSILQSTIGNNFTYTGRQYETETGDLYYRARSYNSKTGHFQQRDPIGFYGGDLNLYRYVVNNPIVFRDPLGLQSTNSDDAWIEDSRIDEFIEDIVKKTKTPEEKKGDCLAYVAETLSGGKGRSKNERFKNKNYSKIPGKRFAKDALPFLEGESFYEVDYDRDKLQKGDVQIIQPPNGTGPGHIQIYVGDGKFYSDFSQTGVYPGGTYRREQPEIKNYRLPLTLNPRNPSYERNLRHLQELDNPLLKKLKNNPYYN